VTPGRYNSIWFQATQTGKFISSARNIAAWNTPE